MSDDLAAVPMEKRASYLADKYFLAKRAEDAPKRRRDEAEGEKPKREPKADQPPWWLLPTIAGVGTAGGLGLAHLAEKTNPIYKHSIYGGALGAGIGGVGSFASQLRGGRRKMDAGEILRAGLLGGTAGAALPYAYHLMQDPHLPEFFKEPDKPRTIVPNYQHRNATTGMPVRPWEMDAPATGMPQRRFVPGGAAGLSFPPGASLPTPPALQMLEKNNSHVKRAEGPLDDLSKFWNNPSNAPVVNALSSGAVGAGIGGLGGLAYGMKSKRAKPGMSALTGALLGGSAGALAPTVWNTATSTFGDTSLDDAAIEQGQAAAGPIVEAKDREERPISWSLSSTTASPGERGEAATRGIIQAAAGADPGGKGMTELGLVGGGSLVPYGISRLKSSRNKFFLPSLENIKTEGGITEDAMNATRKWYMSAGVPSKIKRTYAGPNYADLEETLKKLPAPAAPPAARPGQRPAAPPLARADEAERLIGKLKVEGLNKSKYKDHLHKSKRWGVLGALLGGAGAMGYRNYQYNTQP
jgi:hypothetical protein